MKVLNDIAKNDSDPEVGSAVRAMKLHILDHTTIEDILGTALKDSLRHYAMAAHLLGIADDVDRKAVINEVISEHKSLLTMEMLDACSEGSCSLARRILAALAQANCPPDQKDIELWAGLAGCHGHAELKELLSREILPKEDVC
jgi:hypothetical protein